MAARVPDPGLPNVAPRAAPAPYDTTQAPPEVFGGGMVQPLQKLGRAASEVFAEAKQDADASAVIGAMGDAKRAYYGLILDPEKGYRSLKGNDAIEGRDKALQAFSKRLTEIGADLTDDQARAFQRHALVIEDQGYTHAIAHESAEIENVAKAKFEGAADASIRILQSPGVVASPKDRDQQLSDLLRISTAEAVRRYGRNAPPEVVQSVVGPVMQKAAIDTMEAALTSRNPDVAKTAFERVQPFLGTHLGQYGRMVEALDASRQGDMKGLGIVKGAMGKDGQVDRRAAQDKINAMSPGPVKDRAQHIVDHLASVYDQAWRDEATNMAAGVMDQATNPSGRLDATLIDPVAMERLRVKWPAKAAQIEKAALVDQNRAGIEQSKARYMEAIEDLTDDPESFARMKPAEFDSTYRPLLDSTHFVLFRQRYDKLQRRVDVSPTEAAHVEAEVIRETKKALGLGKAKRISDLADTKKAQVADLAISVGDRVKEWSIANQGKPFPPPDELRRMIADGMMRIQRTDEQQLVEWLPFSPKMAPDFQFQAEAQQRRGQIRDAARAAPPTAGRVNMRAPDGSAVTLPAQQVDEALKQGYRRE